MSDKHPDFIKVVRTLRTERDYTYEQARDTAVRMFAERGWPLPRYMEKFKPATVSPSHKPLARSVIRVAATSGKENEKCE